MSRDAGEPLASEFKIVFDESNFGLPLRDALNNLLGRVPRDDIRFLTTALLLQKETGGNLVQILETTAHLMRQRARTRGQIKIYTAQARATAWVVSALPFLLFIILSLYDPSYERALLEDETGRLMFYGGLCLMIIGILMIRRIIANKV